MEKKFYFSPVIYTGKNAIWSFLIALETEKIWGNLEKADTNDFYRAIEQMKKWLMFGK